MADVRVNGYCALVPRGFGVPLGVAVPVGLVGPPLPMAPAPELSISCIALPAFGEVGVPAPAAPSPDAVFPVDDPLESAPGQSAPGVMLALAPLMMEEPLERAGSQSARRTPVAVVDSTVSELEGLTVLEE